MSRLPVPGQDDDVWGDILNDFLSVSNNPDGTLQTSALTAAGAITTINGQTASNGALTLTPGSIGAPTSLAEETDVAISSPVTNQVLTYNGSRWINQAAAGGAPSGSAGGDLSGSYPNPSVARVNGVSISGTPSSGQIITASSSTAANWTTVPAADATRSVTIVVAASDTDAKGKATADYICTGTSSTGGDEVTIQQALQAVANTPHGAGKVVLLAGIYWRTNPIYLDKPYITLEGQGDGTQITVASNATGYATMIVGSNGSFDGVTYISGDSAPTSGPTEVQIRNVLIQDYESEGVALPGSNHGLVIRGGIVHIDNITVKVTQLDGIRYEGFRQMGAAGTLGASVTTTPTWGTVETWTVNGISSTPGTPFFALVGTADYDPELINVTAVNGTSWTVERGELQSTIKTHSSGAAFTVLDITTVFNNVSTNCFVFSSLRDAFSMQQGVDDSEWVACIVQGGPTSSNMYTRNGFWCGASDVRFIACHPYFCSQYGFYGASYTGGFPTWILIGGEYETCGDAGIYLQQGANCTITGGISIFANATYDIIASNITGLVISDVWMSSAIYRHIWIFESTQVNVHDVHAYGSNSGLMIEVQGTGVNTNAEIDIHDNIFQASDSSYPNAIDLNNIAGVIIHDNILEEGVSETNGSDYNLVHHNTFADPTKGTTLIGAHTTSWDNQGLSDYIYSNSSTVNGQSRKFYQLDGTSNTVTFNPPGANFGGIALAAGSVGVTLPTGSITLASVPATFPRSGRVAVPVAAGWTNVDYEYISGSTLSGCTLGSGTTAAGNVYLIPDLSSTFQVLATNTANTVSIACPAGLAINNSSSPLVLSVGCVYVGRIAPGTSGLGWFIEGRLQTINTGSDTYNGLTIVANSPTQAAALQQWQNSTASNLLEVTNAGVLNATTTTLGTPVFSASLQGDSNGRVNIDSDGSMHWSAGSTAPDVELSRVSPGVLSVYQALSVTGLTGSTAASRYVGATTSGAPASGTFVVGDFIVDQTGKIWICTVSGTPGTWTQPTSSNGGVTSFNSRAGAVVPASGDYTAAQVTGAASTSSSSTQTFTGNVQAPAYIGSGLTGATAASRYVGATTSGAPASGTFVVGDFIVDQTGKIWICTVSGTPGTWTSLTASTTANYSTTYKSGAYIEGQYGVSTSVTLGNNQLHLCPMPVAAAATITQMGAEFTVAGDANSILHMALYADDGTGYPGSLLVDAGSISTGTGNAGSVATGGTPGVYMNSLGTPEALTPGLYWIGGAVQGVTSTQPTMRVGVFGLPFAIAANAVPSAGATVYGYEQAGVSGSMPSSFEVFTSSNSAGTVPRIIIKLQ